MTRLAGSTDLRQAITEISVGAVDLCRTAAFYKHGLALRPAEHPAQDAPLSFQLGSTVLTVQDRSSLASRCGVPSSGGRFGQSALGLIVGTSDEVDGVVERACQAGGKLIRTPGRAGQHYAGYVADPDGNPWKISSHRWSGARWQKARPDRRSSRPQPANVAVTLGTPDLERTRRFYEEGFKCRVARNFSRCALVKLDAGSAELALRDVRALSKLAGARLPGGRSPGIVLTCSTPDHLQLACQLARMERAGGRVTRLPRHEGKGLYRASISDCDGQLWSLVTSD